MKLNLIHTLISIALMCNASDVEAAEARYDFQFQESTPLQSGKWVKISINESGLYEITYEQLKAMGFDDPTKVALFGTGGSLLDFNFTDNKGEPTYSDALNPTPVLHTDGKMIFYGTGTETINASTLGLANRRYRHRRLMKNIYSDRSYYLLTDSQEPVAPESNPVDNKEKAVSVEHGYGCEYHERDLRHNEYMEGQVFWGEEAFVGEPLSFPINKKYCVDLPSFLWLEFANCTENGGTVECSLGSNVTTCPVSNMPPNIYTLGSSSQDFKLTVDNNHIGTGELGIGITGLYPAGLPLAVDYWTLSYPISLLYARDDADFTSQYIAFMDGSSNIWKHPLPDNCVAWDITGRKSPKALDVEDGYFYHNTRYSAQVIAFNPAKTHLPINSDWQKLDNQNLHSLQQEPVSMVIITLPRLKDYAMRIAALHETHGESKVIVVTPEEVYNEFNHGTPDVTALRAFVKMLYHANPQTIKNVLIFGNVYSDYRNIDCHPDRPDGLPVYMIPKVTLKKAEGAEGAACPDYLGVMTDFMNATGLLGNVGVEIGVGLLPISSFEEAEIAVKKIGDYLEKEDFSNLVNEFMTICDTGDSHIHDFQAFGLAELYNKYADQIAGTQFAVSPLWSEGMGFKKVKDTALTSIERGKLFTTYYGHATSSGFGQISFQDLQKLENEEPAFFFMAACDLCEPDRLHHGIGDLGVIRNSKGLMGTICGTRSVLSHENQALSENFVQSLFYDSRNKPRTATASIGELYAQAKTMTNNVSKQAYMLIGDPALPLPIAYGKVSVTTDRTNYRGGEVMQVEGEVLDSNGNCNRDYNGYATIKLMEPKSTEAIIADPIDENGEIQPNPRLVINDYRIATVQTRVKDGKYSARLNLPSKLDNFLSTPDSTRVLNLFVGTYDPSNRMASSGQRQIVMPMAGSAPDPDALHDTQAPSVTLVHDPILNLLTVTATDDTGIDGSSKSSAINLTIDGNQVALNPSMAKDMTSSIISITTSTAHLIPGAHTAVVRAVDAAGNNSEARSLKFEVSKSAPFTLEVSSEVVTEELTVTAKGAGNADLTYVMTDRAGNKIAEGTLTGQTATLDVTDYPAGTYRIAARENSARGAKIYSNWAVFTKID